jgi:MOSC domain-containing protein YiiM
MEVGEVYRINVKAETPGERGIPKRPVDSAWVKHNGIVGDFNRYRHEEKHDDADMAILILALETIQQLNGEGWKVDAGDLGENFTTRGIPYETFAVDKRYRIGEAIVQISKVCDPCSNLYLLPYVGKEKANFIKVMYGRRGWYARVEREGKVKRADKIQELRAQDV